MQMRLHDQLSTNQGLVLEFLISYHLRPMYIERCNDYYGYLYYVSLVQDEMKAYHVKSQCYEVVGGRHNVDDSS